MSPGQAPAGRVRSPQTLAGNHALARHAEQRRPKLARIGRALVQRDKITRIDGERLIGMDGQGQDIELGEPRDSREARAIYITESSVYKAFSNRGQALTAVQMMLTAEAAGVPLPEWRYFEARVVAPGAGGTTDYMIHCARIRGTQFNAAKPGGAQRFANAVNQISDRDVVERILNGVRAAERVGLSDAQGFITTRGVVFFDVHVGGGGGDLIALREAAAARLAQLPGDGDGRAQSASSSAPASKS